MKKRVFSLILAATMALSLAACGGGSANTPAPVESKAAEPGTPTTEIPKMTIKLTQPQPIGTPEDLACLEVKAKLEELSGGNITVEYYPAGQIGSIPESIQSVQMGVTQLAMGPCAIIASYCEDAAMVDLPYLLPQDTSIISEVMNDEIGQEFMGRLGDVGIHLSLIHI